MDLTITKLYKKMRQNMGPSGWWPAESKEEIIIGAIMIQNTNWQNADKAVANFRQQTGFDPEKILQLKETELQKLVQPAGFYKNKSKAVKSVFTWLSKYNFDYPKITNHFGSDLKNELLKLHGVGDETADVFLTYIFNIPTFISDKYSRILFGQLGIKGLSNYQSLAKQVTLPEEFTASEAQDFHGLIDEFGKQYFHPLTRFQDSFLNGVRLII